MKTAVPLDQELPAAVAAGSSRWLISYRNFPVFSRPWLLRRSLLFATVVALWGVLSALVHLANSNDPLSSVQLFGYFFVGVTIMVSAGPVLAGVVRYKVSSERLERILVVVAIIVGLGIAFLADSWSSGNIQRLAGQPQEAELSSTALAINLVVLLAIYLFIGGGLALRAYLGEQRRLAAYEQQQALHTLRQQKIESDQQLSLLQAQIEPHFLFNTLATVRSSIRQDPDRAEATLDALSGFLRATIPRLRSANGESDVMLDEQLEISRQYLQIMKLRMGERLDFRVEADQGARDHPFPPFMLLALVENAIKHGLEPVCDGGQLLIKARLEVDSLVVEVEDNGRGLVAGSGGGVGLSNIRTQLQNRFGDRAALTLTGLVGGGVQARITVPWT